jgi:hypothetical protein
MRKEQQSHEREYGSEADVERISGRSRKTLQKDRLFGRGPFPFYRVGRSIRYDLTEVRAIIRAGRVETGGGAGA